MRLLLTSAGISNPSIEAALISLLGKPIAEATALFIPTAIWALPNGRGTTVAQQVICGTLGDPFCQLGWKSWGILELSTLPTLKRETWLPLLEQTDALLVGGGDCQYLTYWMRHSGLADLLPSILKKTVYVGLSAGSMIMTAHGSTFGAHTLPDASPKSLALLDIAILPHLDHEQFPENSMANYAKEAATLPVPAYAIDDATALQIIDGDITVISEGHWKLFNS